MEKLQQQHTKRSRDASKISQAERDAAENSKITGAGSASGSQSFKKKKGPKKSDKTEKSKEKDSLPPTGLESTATKEGQLMVKMLSTFTKEEQSRFEAFQRGTLPLDTVQEWVAACLCQRFDSDSLSLSHWVDSASDVGMVVASIAKVYAQRLVADAIHHRKSGGDPDQPLTVEDLQAAQARRIHKGLDPGLMFPSHRSSSGALASGGIGLRLPSNEDHETLRLAALAAQDAYDKQQHREPTNKNTDSNVDMDVEPASAISS